VGDPVEFEYETMDTLGGQDGYTYRATAVWEVGRRGVADARPADPGDLHATGAVRIELRREPD
jgi:hypothetical protein